MAGIIRYDHKKDSEFFKTLKSRVEAYFKENNLSKKGDYSMVIKTVFMVLLYFVPYGFMVSGLISSPWIILLMYVVMGFGQAGIGLSVMHDANHGAYSKSAKTNNFISYILEMVGGSSTNWRIQHNVLHHSFTNIEHHDEDIASVGFLLRFSPHSKRYGIHRFQHIYAWVLYGFMNVSWILFKDYFQLARYHKKDLLKGQNTTFGKELTKLIFFKALFFGYVVVLPMLLLPVAWWIFPIGLIIMLMISGFVLAIVFQPAHVMEHNSFPLPDDEGLIEDHFAVHQLRTTTNFAPKNKAFGWYVGGLNFQVEHHLFPNVCHIHYRNLSPIVQQTAQEFGIPYHSQKSFAVALLNHSRMLKQLGRA